MATEITVPDSASRAAGVDLDVASEKMSLSMGPSHPSTHGVLRLQMELDRRDDLARTYPAAVPRPRWAEDAYDGGRLDPVVRTLERYHHTAVRPVWSAVRTGVEQARQRLTALLLNAGVEGMLSHLHTSIRWNAPEPSSP